MIEPFRIKPITLVIQHFSAGVRICRLLLSQLANFKGFRSVWLPLLKMAVSQKVLVIKQ